MDAIVSDDLEYINNLNSELLATLNNSGLKFLAVKYCEPIKHPTKDLYAIPLVTSDKYNIKIIQSLKEPSISRIQKLGKKWFKELNI